MLQNFTYYAQIMLRSYVAKSVFFTNSTFPFFYLKLQNIEYHQSLLIYFPNIVQFCLIVNPPTVWYIFSNSYTYVCTCINTFNSFWLHLQQSHYYRFNEIS